MRILRIYSNESFRNILFNETGLNVILGEIYDPEDMEKDTHNLGKSLLIEVIDFVLLKGVPDKSKFFLTNGNFSGKNLFGEILLNDGNLLVIRRGVDQPSKISFRLSKERLSDFSTDIEWDEEDLSFNESKKRLNKYLSFDVLSK